MKSAKPLPNLGSDATVRSRNGFPGKSAREQGVGQHDPSNAGFTTQNGIPVGRRSAPRLRLAIPARLITLYGSNRCILIDLSSTGAQLGLESPLDIGETAILEIAGKELFCDIVRKSAGSNGGVNGLTFDPPLSEQMVLEIRRFSETYQSEELQGLRSEVRAWVQGSVRVRS